MTWDQNTLTIYNLELSLILARQWIITILECLLAKKSFWLLWNIAQILQCVSYSTWQHRLFLNSHSQLLIELETIKLHIVLLMFGTNHMSQSSHIFWFKWHFYDASICSSMQRWTILNFDVTENDFIHPFTINWYKPAQVCCIW